jgi:type I restriction enzyme S subunit
VSVDGWREVRLGDVCESVSNTHSFGKSELIFLNTSDVYEGSILHNKYSPVANMPGQAKKSIKKGDILYSEIRPKNRRYAMVNFDASDYVVSTKFMVIRSKGLIDNKFLYLYLTSDEVLETLQQVAEARSGTFPQITFTQVAELNVSLPPLPEQKAIVATLSALDDMIELNNQINKTLEEMAQAIFKSWFVDFEPFKDGEFEKSELGPIPKGWKAGRLGDIVDIFDSKRVPLSSRQRSVMEKKYPYYGAATLMDYVDDYIFEGVHVLLGEDGTVMDEKGYPILQYVWGKFWVNNHAHVLKGKGIFSDEYLYMLLKNTNVASIVTGAVQPKINQGNLIGLKVIIPPDDAVKQYNEIVKDIFACLRSNDDEQRVLMSLRDTLLPKLMSGEIRVPVEEVV